MSEHNELRFFSSYLLLFVFLNLTCLSFALRNCILQGVHDDTFLWWSRIRRAGVKSCKIQRFFPDPDPESQVIDTRDPVREELCIFNSIRSPLGLTLKKRKKCLGKMCFLVAEVLVVWTGVGFSFEKTSGPDQDSKILKQDRSQNLKMWPGLPLITVCVFRQTDIVWLQMKS